MSSGANSVKTNLYVPNKTGKKPHVMAFLHRSKSKVCGECPNIFLANAFEAVLSIFLTIISLTFGSDHTTQKMLGVSQE